MSILYYHLSIEIFDLVFRNLRYACIFQKHTKHTLFCVFMGLDCRLKHCVLTLVNEQSLLRSSDRFKFKVFLQVSSLARATSLRGV
jgi:hypothetical protein